MGLMDVPPRPRVDDPRVIQVPIEVMVAILRSVGGSFTFDTHDLTAFDVRKDNIESFQHVDPFRYTIRLVERE